MCLGILVLQVEFPLPPGALAALVDTRPMLEAVTILVPRDVLAMLQGQTVLRLGLIGLYGVASLTRSIPFYFGTASAVVSAIPEEPRKPTE